jgi:hypothetical protein
MVDLTVYCVVDINGFLLKLLPRMVPDIPRRLKILPLFPAGLIYATVCVIWEAVRLEERLSGAKTLPYYDDCMSFR